MTYLTATRGDTFRVTFTWTDSDDDPINLTGYTVTFTVNVNDTVETYTPGSGLTVTAGTGTIELHIDEDVTAEWGSNPTWRLKVVSPGDDVTTLARGNIRVS